MEGHIEIERPGKGQEEEKQRGRVKYADLHIAQKRRSAKDVGAPERHGSAPERSGQKEFHGIEQPMDIPEEQGFV
jgi:hypothetical protein